MKKTLLFLCLFAGFGATANAQQKIVERAIVQSKSEFSFPQNANRAARGDEDDGGGFSSSGNRETKTTVYFKGDLIKTLSKSDFGNSTVIIDKKNKRTTTLTEAMGRKTGFYTTEEDEEAMRKRMDSLRNARGQSAGNRDPQVEIIATNDTRKIAGYNCKKVIVKTRTMQGSVNEATVWFTPDFKMAPGYPASGNTGGMGRGASMRGGGNMGFGLSGLDKIDGFVMAVEVKRPNGFEMTMEVTKVELDPVIEDKVFEIPKGYDIKPMSEMQGRFGQGGRRRGNN
ncbi:MAG: DUF4412 domain-containing protein [Chitinophagaceae bacterium]|nr:DUF4412 domain-containing protein [Chitinophagaceae bacterium]